MTRHSGPSPSIGLLAGLAGGVGGLATMALYWKGVSQFQSSGDEDRPPSQRTSTQPGIGHTLDDISIVGRQHHRGETSTAATGRILYHAVTGHDPDEETHHRLDHGVHWAYGISMGGLYGVLRRRARFPDLTGGLFYSTGLWLVGDELVVPLLGLQDGPTAATPGQHLNRFAAHLAYGAGLAVTTQALLKLIGSKRNAQNQAGLASRVARSSRDRITQWSQASR